MAVHLFGAASSPNCANFALKRVAEDHKTEFDLETIQTVGRNFYVDDCLKSVDSNERAIRLANQLRNLLAKAGFKLTKWTSNSAEVLMSLPESERYHHDKPRFLGTTSRKSSRCSLGRDKRRVRFRNFRERKTCNKKRYLIYSKLHLRSVGIRRAVHPTSKVDHARSLSQEFGMRR